MDSAVRTQRQRNTRAQVEFATEFGLLTAVEVAAATPCGSGSRVLQWATERRVFSVEVDGTQRLPGFQLDKDGRPLPVVADVLASFAGALGPWELALWFTGSNGWLGGQRPVDVMVEHPAAVVDAARRLATEIADAD